MVPLAKTPLLMCRPDHFGVTYAINPWMDPISWALNFDNLAATSQREWAALHNIFTNLGASIEFVPAVAGLPDLVFTANAAVVLDGTALLSRFRYPERQNEQAYFEFAFQGLQARGIIDAVEKLPDNLVLEGAGDCVWDWTRKAFWMGYGQRSDAASRNVVHEIFGADVIVLELAESRFYHIDTALCALPRGEILYFPQAFTRKSRAAIRERAMPAQLIEVGVDDAYELAANAVCIGNAVIMSSCGEPLRAELIERGYRVVTTPLRSFLRSGGSACCLTLRLDYLSSPAGASRRSLSRERGKVG
jgi:N-dimethylarginine dimethylaminohydrolase